MGIVGLAALLAGARPETQPIALRDGNPITLARWRADIEYNAERLAANRIRRGALVCEDGYWFMVGLLALIRIGAGVILPPNEQPGMLRGLQSEFDALVSDSNTAEAGRRIVIESSGSEAAPLHLDLEHDRIGFFTSGSTGDIRQVSKTLKHFELEAGALEAMWGDRLEGAQIFGTVTHQHVFGMTFRLMWPILAGRPFESSFQVAWEPLLERLPPRSVIVSSPAQLTRLGGLTPLPAAQRPLMVLTAGAPLPDAAAAEAAAIFGCAPIEIFGSTEAGVIGWRDAVPGPISWRPLTGVEIATTTGGVMLLQSRHACVDGWSEQADRISILGDGRFCLEGRVDRIVKIEGKRVSLERMEHALSALPWIAEAAVVSLGENPLYLGVVAKLAPLGAAEIKRLGKFRFERLLRRELAQIEDAAVLPRRWRFVETIPLNGMGKRRTADLQALFAKST
ncbi:MAG: acyl-CoA synthetase [Candidatus Binataceae bacterium]|nr:acyl-CoA synthetase [Candidatus Binataceae bacterium]